MVRPTGSLTTQPSPSAETVAAPEKTQPEPQPEAIEKVYTIQVAAFKNQKDADRRVAQLKEQGLNAYTTVSEKSNNIRWYRVRIGMFQDRQQALDLIDRLKADNITAILVKI